MHSADPSLGFDAGKLIRPDRPEPMSYCAPFRVSGYYFDNALRFRLSDEATGARASRRETVARTILTWGGGAVEGAPFLEPAFAMDAPPHLPAIGGDHRIALLDADDRELFSLDFAMPTLADGDGSSSSYAFLLPADDRWVGSVARITLSGPGGSDALDEDASRPLTILRGDPTAARAPAAQGAAGRADLEALFSRGPPNVRTSRR